MCLFQGALDTPLDSPFSANGRQPLSSRFALHGLCAFEFSRKSGAAPKCPEIPRNSHWIHTKSHAKPHWLPLNFPEFSRNVPNFSEIVQIPPNPWNFRKIKGGEEFTQSASYGSIKEGSATRTFACLIQRMWFTFKKGCTPKWWRDNTPPKNPECQRHTN